MPGRASLSLSDTGHAINVSVVRTGPEIRLDAAAGRRPGSGQFLLAALLALAVLAPAARAPFSRDDLLAVVEIEDIVQRGHWLVNHDQYPELFDTMARDQFGPINRKPPLFYWLSALAVEAAGGHVDTLTARIVPLTAAVAIALMTLGWTAVWIGPETGWLAFLFAIGSYGFAARATTVLTDMTMTALLFASWCLIYPMLQLRKAPAGRVFAVGTLLGLATLAKGPIAIGLCAIGAMVYLTMEGRNPISPLGRRWPWVVLTIACAIAAAWLVPAMMVSGRALGRVMIDENLGHLLPRVAGGIGESERPPWFIVARLIGATFPPCLLFPAAIVAVAGYGFDRCALRPVRFQASMAIAVLLIFSVASIKRSDYVLPAIVPLAIANAALFTRLEESLRRARIAIRLRNIGAALICGGTLAVIAASLIAARRVDSSAMIASVFNKSEQVYVRWFIGQVGGFRPLFSGLVALCAAGAIIGLVALYRRDSRSAGFGVAFVVIGLAALWTGEVTPMRLRHESLAPFARSVGRIAGDRNNLYLVPGYYDREIAFDLGRYVPYLAKPAREEILAGRSIYVVAGPADAARAAAAMRATATELESADPIVGHRPPALYLFSPMKARPRPETVSR